MTKAEKTARKEMERGILNVNSFHEIPTPHTDYSWVFKQHFLLGNLHLLLCR